MAEMPERKNNCFLSSREKSTSRDQHRREVEKIIEELKGESRKKTIACRRIIKEGRLNISESFQNLCDYFPDAFVFLFSTPVTGNWIGASPELLMNMEDSVLSTYSLAGTRKAGSAEMWDEKNINEQKIVTDYIVDMLKRYGLEPKLSPRATRRAGNIEHLFCEIYASTKIKPFDLINLLENFSPTPALCGMPKDESFERIERLEPFPRKYYGGFCGPFLSEKKFTLFVNLRSLEFDNAKYCIYVGGGITHKSNPDMEWSETEIKSESILKSLKFYSPQ